MEPHFIPMFQKQQLHLPNYNSTQIYVSHDFSVLIEEKQCGVCYLHNHFNINVN